MREVCNGMRLNVEEIKHHTIQSRIHIHFFCVCVDHREQASEQKKMIYDTVRQDIKLIQIFILNRS